MNTAAPPTSTDKQLSAHHAAGRVRDGMIVGLGTGSTANFFIEELGRLCRDHNLKITTVSSSIISAIKAQEAGLLQQSIEHTTHLDLYVDGADEVLIGSGAGLTLLKGRGADLVREKILARAAAAFVVLADATKLVHRIGERFPIPVEVQPWAWRLVLRRLEALGGRGALRLNPAKDGAAMTSSGNLVLEMTFDPSFDSKTLDTLLSGIPGLIEHGIFCGLATSLLLANNGHIKEVLPS